MFSKRPTTELHPSSEPGWVIWEPIVMLCSLKKKKCLEAKDWGNLREKSPPTEDKQV